MNPQSLKDVFIRVPWWAMDQRPDQTVKNNVTRQSDHLQPGPNQGEEGNPS